MRLERGAPAGVRPGAAMLLATAMMTLALALPSPAQAGVPGERLIAIPSPGPGPSQLDRVWVNKIGPADPDRVLVLMPGTAGGAGDFTLVGRDIVERVPGLAVWAIDRRSQPLEDRSKFEELAAGEATLQETFDYYLGWITNGGTPAEHFEFIDALEYPYARRWGMKTTLNDARRVVRRARSGGDREVWLGGHSLGASLSAAYAAWDFKGRPGYRDLAGIVMIDGGLLGSFDAFTLGQARQQIEQLQLSSPFAELLGLSAFPGITGLFAEVGGYYAKLDPTASATTLQSYPLLPDQFDPGFPVTNRALFGFAFDRDTSSQALRLLHVNGGALAAAGDPRDWEDGGVTPVANLAATFGQEPVNAVEWYFPKRLTIDTNGANAMRMNDVAEFLGLRLEHTRAIDVPIYAFQTALTDGGVLRGAKRLVRRAETRRSQAHLVNGAPEQSHLDPLTADPSQNEFLETVVEFLGD
jgi:pimeloyl-ACP methyl ester carboxylesterase